MLQSVLYLRTDRNWDTMGDAAAGGGGPDRDRGTARGSRPRSPCAPARRVGPARRRWRPSSTGLFVLGFVLLFAAAPHHYHLSKTELFGIGTGHPRAHAGHAPRLRRRPHLGHRQHHPQADGGGQAAAQRGLLLLARPLVGRLRAGGPPELRHPGARRPGAHRRLGLHSVTGIVGTSVFGNVPLPDRRAQRRHPRLDPAGLPRPAVRACSTRRSSSASSTSEG